MSHFRQSIDELPMVVTLLASAMARGKDGCVLTDQSVMCVGFGSETHAAELDAISRFGTKLNSATMYVNRMPEGTILKLLEKCRLRRLVVLVNDIQSTIHSHRGCMEVEQIGGALNCLRDMVRSLEQSCGMGRI